MSIFDKRGYSKEELPAFSPKPYDTYRPLVASAAKVDLKNKKEVDAISKRRQADKWQEEAWDYYDYIGEIKYSANLIAQVMSRINLYPAYVADTSSVPSRIGAVENLEEGLADAARNILHWLESGNGGTSGLLRNAALNMFVVGECYLVKEPARPQSGEGEKWQIRSIDEIISTTGRNATVAIKPRRDSKPAEFIPLPKNGYISRIWRNHPRFSDEADSSLRGILDICDELLLLGRSASATSKSRLNGGLLFVPDGLSNVSQSDGDFEDPDAEPTDTADLSDDESDAFEEELIDAMVTPIEDVSSAASVVPLVVRGPEELGEKIKYITFERSFDPQLSERSDTVLERILAGLDIPKDVAKGLSSVKYSNAILIEEQLFKAHIEPLVLMIVDALTVGFLRPALRSQGFGEDQVSRTVLWYDPSAVTAKPSKAESATTGYEIGAISHDSWRRAHGFTDSDAPSQLEIAQRMAKEKGMLNEPLTEKLVATMVPDLMSGLRDSQLNESDPESADALTDALGGDEDMEKTVNADEQSDIMNSENRTQAPSTLLEP